MAKVLLADVLIGWLRGRQSVVQQILALIEEHQELFCTPVSVAEIVAAVREGEESTVTNLFLLLEPASITAHVGERAGHYLNSYGKSHGLQLGDALIAACASTEGLSLWTPNRKQYPMRDLQFLY